MSAVDEKYIPVETASAVYNTTGTFNLIAPATKDSLLITWICVQAASTVGEAVVRVTLSLTNKSYVWELTGFQPMVHSTMWRGKPGDPFKVTLNANLEVLVNVDYRVIGQG